MNELLGFCSPSLIALLAGNGPEEEMVERTKSRIVEEIDALGTPAALILRSRYGIGCPHLTRSQIARLLKLRNTEVRRLEEEALFDLGFALVCRPSEAAAKVAA